MYYKGGNMLRTIRQVVANDSTWRAVLRGLNGEFAHRVVTGRQVQEYISAHTGVDHWGRDPENFEDNFGDLGRVYPCDGIEKLNNV
jgi:hypothetical protein